MCSWLEGQMWTETQWSLIHVVQAEITHVTRWTCTCQLPLVSYHQQHLQSSTHQLVDAYTMTVGIKIQLKHARTHHTNATFWPKRQGAWELTLVFTGKSIHGPQRAAQLYRQDCLYLQHHQWHHGVTTHSHQFCAMDACVLCTVYCRPTK